MNKIISHILLHWLQYLIIAAISVIYLHSLFNKKSLPATENIFQKISAPAKIYQDKQGKTHIEKPLPQGSNKELETFYKSTIDSLKKALNISRKNLREFITIGSQTTGEVSPVFNAQNCDFTYQDQFLKIDYSNKKMQYSIYDSIILTTHVKRPKWYQAKELYIDAYSINPATKITGMTAFKITTPQGRRLGIGAFIGYGFNGSGFYPVLGLGLNYQIIRF